MKNSKFSLVLKQIRENAGLTQSQVANALNLERSTYAYYETGTSHPNGMMIIRLANIFNVDYKIFMDAIGDVEFDNSPEDTSYTTLSDSSAMNREKMYTLRKEEQDLIVIYRSLSDEQKDKVRKLISELNNANKKPTKRKKKES